ncbi:MAG: prepilin-type N-terminal cleavage/methylation domain-containing protein [Planctomycetota bacterium]|nr:prepilin-type N-terminal cleavage/methylation domain-containing protein [Planctomycetota bacterium]
MTTRPGLTLVELLAALAVMTLLTVAAVNTTLAITRALPASVRAHAAAARRAALEALLEADVVNADKYRLEGGALWLETQNLLDGESLEGRRRPAVVTYRIINIQGRPWLVRGQTAGMDPQTGELVCPGVRGIDLLDADDPDRGDRWRRIPAEPVIVIDFDDPGEPGGKQLRPTFRTRTP